MQEMHLKSVYCTKYTATVDMGLLWQLSAPSSADREKVDGTLCTCKDYVDIVFKIILIRHLSASMIIAIDDYYWNDVINVKDGEFQNCSAAFVGGQTWNVFAAKEKNSQV